MKILKLEATGLPINKQDKVLIDFTPSKKVSLDVDEEVFELSNNIQVFNTIGFYGMNATGKTSVLKLIEFAHLLYYGKATIKELRAEIPALAGEMQINALIYEGEFIYNISTLIQEDEIIDEAIVAIPVNEIKSKKKLHEIALLIDCNEIEEVIGKKGVCQKNDLVSFEEFINHFDESNQKLTTMLKNEIFKKKSIANFVITDSENVENNIKSTINRTNFNMCTFPTLKCEPRVLNNIARLLDSNIEEIRFLNQESSDVKIKFYNQQPINIKYKHMQDFLSAGTIRGLNLFQDAFSILLDGGTLIVDEIDMNLNLSIVEQLILLFKNKEVNTHNSLLIFSTHVPTLIDLLDRDDNIYILKKEHSHIVQKKLSEFNLRYDKVKSNSLISGDIGTNPKYEYFSAMLKSVFNG